jgi:hypothetical protein
MFVLLASAGFCGLVVAKNVLYADGAPIRSALTAKVPARQINGSETTHTICAFSLEYKDEKPVLKPHYLHTNGKAVVLRPDSRILLSGRKRGEAATLWRVVANPANFYNVDVILEPETSATQVNRYELLLHSDIDTQYIIDVSVLPKTISTLAD